MFGHLRRYISLYNLSKLTAFCNRIISDSPTRTHPRFFNKIQPSFLNIFSSLKNFYRNNFFKVTSKPTFSKIFDFTLNTELVIVKLTADGVT